MSVKCVAFILKNLDHLNFTIFTHLKQGKCLAQWIKIFSSPKQWWKPEGNYFFVYRQYSRTLKAILVHRQNVCYLLMGSHITGIAHVASQEETRWRRSKGHAQNVCYLLMRSHITGIAHVASQEETRWRRSKGHALLQTKRGCCTVTYTV